MTQEQYERWKDFAFRMARTGLALNRKKSIEKVVGMVGEFFEALECGYIGHGQEWFSEPPHDGFLDRVRSWDHTDAHPTWRDQFGHKSIGPFVCDIVTGLDEHWNPHYWEAGEAAYGRWDELWGSRVRCCLRAGIDMACEPSAGVIGFTAGDLRRMYPEGVPEWVFQPEERLRYWLTDELNGTFPELPDDALIVL